MSEAIKGLYQRYCNETDLIIKAALKAQLNFHGVEVGLRKKIDEVD